MIKQLKTFTVNMVAGANVATILLMVLAGYADRINPVEHPMLSCMGMTFPIFLIANMLFVFFWLIFKWRLALLPLAGMAFCSSSIRAYFPI